MILSFLIERKLDRLDSTSSSACYGVLRFIMESGAQGCEIVVSGKLRGQRAKAMKFIDGLMIHSGDPVNDYVQYAVRHVLLRQGVLGIKVKIMLPYENKDGAGAKKPLPDHISIVQPKEETPIAHPYSESKERKVDPVSVRWAEGAKNIAAATSSSSF